MATRGKALRPIRRLWRTSKGNIEALTISYMLHTRQQFFEFFY